ncbi:hypothetical protein Taro_004010, partial [Colocasia esculenta]|nr:hypothetical protein [Colocasia esculenta]
MASRGRRGGAPARYDEQRREERAEQQAPAPQGPVLPRRLWIMECSCNVWCKPCRPRHTLRQHSRPSWRPRLVAFDHRTLDEALSAACRQEGEMEQYLEEKKASQKRPATTFQRQDKRKTVYQTPQKQVAVSNS